MNFNAYSLIEFFLTLYKLGVRDFVVSPGSRSTPLALCAHELQLQTQAFSKNKRARCFVGIDERSCAFFALGRARATGRSACLICTSGTAPAHYLPALLEAKHSRVPMIVLSADRPPQAQNMGAPQTTDQVKIFGSAVEQFFQTPVCNATNCNANAETNYASQLALDVYTAASLPVAAPVQMNVPLEDTLALDECFLQDRMHKRLQASTAFYPRITQARAQLGADELQDLCALIQAHKTALVVGPLSGERQELEELLKFAAKYELPLLPDPLSQLRSWNHHCCISSYDSLIKQQSIGAFDLVIRFGSFPVSKALFTAQIDSELVVDESCTRDFVCKTARFVRMSPVEFARALNTCSYTASEEQKEYLRSLRALDDEFWLKEAQDTSKGLSLAQIVEEQRLTEASCVRDILVSIPEESLLFCGNSMPIRHLDACYKAANKRIYCMAHRGLNGIDGTVAAALGVSLNFDRSTCIVGDLTFLHDVSSLAFAQELKRAEFEYHNHSCVIVVFNNKGGAIFGKLFQKEYTRHFERLFVCEQQTHIKLLALAYGLSYVCVSTDQRSFKREYEVLLQTPGVHVLEVLLAE